MAILNVKPAGKGYDISVKRPIVLFLLFAIAVGLGVMIFTLLLYCLIQIFTSSGFSELKAENEDGRERIDNNDDLEDA